MKTRMWITAGLSALMIAAGSFVAGVYAAPVRPSKPKLPPMVESLIGVTEVQLVIRDIPADLDKVGVTRNMVAQRVKEMLQEEDVRIVEPSENPMAPELQFLAVSVREPKVGDALAYVYVLSLHQTMTHKGLKTDMTLPTWTVPVIGLERDEDLQEPAFRNVEFILKAFTRDLDRARIEGAARTP